MLFCIYIIIELCCLIISLNYFISFYISIIFLHIYNNRSNIYNLISYWPLASQHCFIRPSRHFRHSIAGIQPNLLCSSSLAIPSAYHCVCPNFRCLPFTSWLVPLRASILSAFCSHYTPHRRFLVCWHVACVYLDILKSRARY